MSKKYLYTRKYDDGLSEWILTYLGTTKINKEYRVVFQCSNSEVISFAKDRLLAMISGEYKNEDGNLFSLGLIDDSRETIFFPDAGILHDAY